MMISPIFASLEQGLPMSAIRRVYFSIVLVLSSTSAYADDKKIPAGLEGVQADGFAMVTINVAQLWDFAEFKPLREALAIKNPLTAKLEESIGFKLGELERVTFYWPGISPEKRDVVPFNIFTTRKPYDRAKIVKSLNAKTAGELTDKLLAGEVAEIAGKNVYFADREALIFVNDRTVIVGADLRQLESITTFLKVLGGVTAKVGEGPLADALAVAGKHTIVVGADFAPVRKALEAAGEVPAEYKPLASMVQAERGLVMFDVGQTVKATAKLTFFDADTAKKAEPDAKKIVALALARLADFRKAKGRDDATDAVLVPLLDFAKTALDKCEVTLDGKSLSAGVGGEIDAAMKKLLAGLPTWAEAESARMQTGNNLKQFGLALHSYHDVMGTLPQDIFDKDGKAILSWRVELLPYIEQTALYNQIDRTKPWDDAANKAFVERMPEVFKHFGRATKEKGFTHFQTFTAEKAIEGGNPLLVPGRKLRLLGITDGTSNTLMVVDGETAVNWLKPGDLPYDPKKVPRIGDPKTGKFIACMGDGSVRWFDLKKLGEKKLHALITVDGGEVVNLDE